MATQGAHSYRVKQLHITLETTGSLGGDRDNRNSVEQVRAVRAYGVVTSLQHLLPLKDTETEPGHANPVSSFTRAYTEARAYRTYLKSLMCKQLLLFAQTTCSFWTQTQLWRRMGCVNSVGCVGEAFHKRSLSTWCRLHQMVGPGRTAASSNRTHTALKEPSVFGLQHTDMFCFLQKYNFPLGAGEADADCLVRVILKRQEATPGPKDGGEARRVYFEFELKHSEALRQKPLNESSQNHSRSLVMPLTVSH